VHKQSFLRVFGRVSIPSILLGNAALSACGGEESPSPAYTAGTTIVQLGDAAGVSSCIDGAAACGCGGAVITFPLKASELQAVDAGDGGVLSSTTCSRLCPPNGGAWFSCQPFDDDGGATFVSCRPFCL
jgi:hypothetical protein